jgi:hypothetical protein
MGPQLGRVKELQCVEFDTAAFNIHYEWLYARHIVLDQVEEEDSPRGEFDLDTLIETFHLGIEIQNDRVCKTLLNAFTTMRDHSLVPDRQSIDLLYKIIEGDSTERRGAL